MKRVFVDANIVIDLLCERYPWFPGRLRDLWGVKELWS